MRGNKQQEGKCDRFLKTEQACRLPPFANFCRGVDTLCLLE